MDVDYKRTDEKLEILFSSIPWDSPLGVRHEDVCRRFFQNEELTIAQAIEAIKPRLNSDRDHSWSYLLGIIIKMIAADSVDLVNSADFIRACEVQLQYGKSTTSRHWIEEFVHKAPIDILLELSKRIPTDSSIIKLLGNSENRKASILLCQLLDDSYKEVWREVIEALRSMRDPDTFDSLSAMIKYENEYIKLLTMETLFTISPQKAIPIIRELVRDGSIRIQLRGMQLLASVRDKLASNILVQKLLYSDNSSVRISAAKALGQIRAKDSLDGILVSLQDTHFEVRGMAAWSLGEIGDSQAIEQLKAVEKDENIFTAWSARCAIEKILNQN